MPEDGSKLADVAVLADAAARVEITVPLASLGRLAPLLAGTAGEAHGVLGFARERGQVIADVEAEAKLALQCQRCLGEFVLPVSGRSRVALVPSEAAVESVPEDLESALAPEGRIRLRELVEEELLLALPASPRHPGPCTGAVEEVSAAGAGVQRPLAGLGELLGRPKN